MSTPDRYQWRRDKDRLGVWVHHGNVSMDKTLGAYSIPVCRRAMEDAGSGGWIMFGKHPS